MLQSFLNIGNKLQIRQTTTFIELKILFWKRAYNLKAHKLFLIFYFCSEKQKWKQLNFDTWIVYWKSYYVQKFPKYTEISDIYDFDKLGLRLCEIKNYIRCLKSCCTATSGYGSSFVAITIAKMVLFSQQSTKTSLFSQNSTFDHA